jgi:fibro-slime domain-containing protein
MPVSAPGSVFDQNPVTNEILWWTNGADGITATGSGPFKLGVVNNMFAPNSTGSNDQGLYETAILHGELEGTGADAKISVSSDDDSLVYVDGLYVGGLPGVHGTESTTIDLGTLGAGVKDSVEVFYADRANVGANLLVGVAGAAVVPEPATWAMMLFGVGMIGGGLRIARRKNGMALTAA